MSKEPNLLHFELMDRAHTLELMFHELIGEHPSAQFLQEKVTAAGNALGNLYQSAGCLYSGNDQSRALIVPVEAHHKITDEKALGDLYQSAAGQWHDSTDAEILQAVWKLAESEILAIAAVRALLQKRN